MVKLIPSYVKEGSKEMFNIVKANQAANQLMTTGIERLTISVAEAGKMLGISRASAYKAVREGEIPVIKLGKRRVVPLAAITRMMEVGDV
jgi:excisionase family DNA binding protein